jgi:hypothetical protein
VTATTAQLDACDAGGIDIDSGLNRAIPTVLLAVQPGWPIVCCARPSSLSQGALQAAFLDQVRSSSVDGLGSTPITRPSASVANLPFD